MEGDPVIQTVREKFSCRACETIIQPPSPFHVTPRGFAGPNLLAMILLERFGQHQPLNRQSERYRREGIDPSLSTLADQVGACTVQVRKEQSAPLLAALEAWLREQRARLSNSSSVAKPIDYMLRRWDRFVRFIDDGRICLTNNAAERALRGLPSEESRGSSQAPSAAPIVPQSW